MRKLKLQMQITADGFVAGPNGELDWATDKMDEKLLQFINYLVDTSDTILMGRKMTPGFIKYWEHEIAKPEGPQYSFARKMVELPKVAFSRTQDAMEGQNLRVENGDLRNAIGRLKQAPGKDIIVYGGASFVASLIENALIDEFNLFVAPLAIGNGMRIFKDRRPFTLTASIPYPCGVVVNTYEPR
ncbi:MAG: dihydrofolate reductase family protein [Acidobacteriia bacterium]|nr:dihydrofolate reductase family protein [Terriglobia bacterium]